MPTLIQFVRYICVTRAEKKTRLSFLLFDTRPINLLEITSASVPTGKTVFPHFNISMQNLELKSIQTPLLPSTHLPHNLLFQSELFFSVVSGSDLQQPCSHSCTPRASLHNSCSAGTCTGPAGHTDTCPRCQMQLKIFINV